MATVNGTLNQDTWLNGNAPTTNNNGSGSMTVGDSAGNDKARAVLKFTMPANPGGGTITKIEVGLYNTSANGAGSYDVNLYQGTSTPATTWVDSQATWDIYKTSNNWTAAGGASDYSATIIDSFARPFTTSVYSYWVIQGTGATNPLSLTWGDTVNLLVRAPSSTGNNDFFQDSGAANPPVLIVTYTAVLNIPDARVFFM